MSESTNQQFKKTIFPAVASAVRISSALKAQDIGFQRSLDRDLATKSKNVSGKFIGIANELIQAISGEDEKIDEAEPSELNHGSNWNILSNSLDHLFEKADILFDEAKRGKLKDNYSEFTYLEESNTVSRGQFKKIEKPQLNFKVPVDNRELGPFKPKLTEKPNCLKTFEESVKLVQPDNELDPAYYPHPYEYEIDNQKYPDIILTKSLPIASRSWNDTEAIWIDKPEQISDLVERLSGANEIAIDLEHHDYRTYYGLVCLMQISTRDQDWIIDTLALRDDLTKLNAVFTNPDIVKVFHGAFMDIIWLQRDLGLYIVSLFDTYHASRKLGFPKFSLAYLLETYAKFKTSKKYQLADWRIRPLPTAMLSYARSDTHFLLNIFDQLKNALIEKNEDALRGVLKDSRQVAKRRFEYTKFRPVTSSSLVNCPIMAQNPSEPYQSIVGQFNIPHHVKPVVAVLYEWRDRLARDLDESVRYIMSNQTLAYLSTLRKPVTAKSILNVATYTTEFVRNNAEELAGIINRKLLQLEENDWDLMDQAHTAMDSTKSLVLDDSSLQSVELQTKLFNEVYDEKSDLLAIPENSPSLISNSKTYNDNNVLGCKFGKKATFIPSKELGNRKRFTEDEFLKFYVSEKPEFESEAPERPQPDVTPAIEEEAPAKEISQTIESEDDIFGNKEEIITLSKHKKQNNKKQGKNKKDKSQNQEASKKRKADEPAFDYEQAESMLSSSTETQSKKKKFNPYAKNTSTGGFKPVKKSKTFHNGRSTTFKK